MLTEQSPVTDFSVVSRMLDAIEQGDTETLRSCFTADAQAWHNNDEIEQNVDDVIALISHLCAVSTSRTYKDRRIATVGSQAFIQHILTAELRSGRQLRMPAMMRLVINPEGLVERLEEYLDSRAVDCLAEETP